MKKKTEDKKLDNDLDFGDLEDLGEDLDINFDDLGDIDAEDRKPSFRKVSKKLAKEASKDFFESLITKTIEKSLPESYKENYYVVADYVDLIKGTFESNKNKISKSLYYLGKEVKKILPFQFKMLDNFLEKYKSELESAKIQSEEEIRESIIKSTISSIFDKQLEIIKAIEAKRSAEEEVDRKQTLHITKTNLEVLSSIDRNIANQTAFTLQINKEYYRKSLELQYKSYFVQADILKEIKTYFKAFSKQFEDIQHNTSLPDFVKLHKSEAVAQTLQNQIVTSLYKQVFSNFEYVNKIKKRFSNFINEKISELVEGISSLTNILSNINQAKEIDNNDNSTLIGALTSLLGSELGEKVAEKISPKIKNMIKDNKYINVGGNYLSIIGSSPRTLFTMLREKTQKAREKYITEETPIKYVASKLLTGINDMLNILDPGLEVPEIKKESILTHNKPAIFDNKVHRSITEIIPMYLAKILKENTSLKEMYRLVNKEKLEGFRESRELVYDYINRKLTTEEEAIKTVQDSVFKETSKESEKLKKATSYISSKALSFVSDVRNKDIDKNIKKIISNQKAQKDFQKFVSIASTKIKDSDFSYDTIITNVDKLVDKIPELKELLDQNDSLRKYIKALQSLELNKKYKDVEEKVKDVKRVYPVSAIIELFNTASKFVNEKPSELSNESASFISRTWLIYINATKKLITLDKIIKGDCFNYMPNDYTKDILSDISELISNCAIIKTEGDIYKISTIERLISKVNESLLGAYQVNPEVLKTLYHYSPKLVEPFSFSADRDKLEAMRKSLTQIKYYSSGTIGNQKSVKDIGIVDEEILLMLKRRKNNEINDNSESISNIEKKIVTKSVFENLSNTFKDSIPLDNIKDQLSSIKSSSSPEEVSNTIKNIFKKITTISQEYTKKTYRLANEKLNKAYDSISKMFEDIKDKSSSEALLKIKNKMLETSKEYIKSVDLLISKEKEVLAQEEKSIEEIYKDVETLTNNPELHKSMLEARKSIIESKKKEIHMLEEFKKYLLKIKEEIFNLDIRNTDEFKEKTRNIFDSFISKSKEILSKYES